MPDVIIMLDWNFAHNSISDMKMSIWSFFDKTYANENSQNL